MQYSYSGNKLKLEQDDQVVVVDFESRNRTAFKKRWSSPRTQRLENGETDLDLKVGVDLMPTSQSKRIRGLECKRFILAGRVLFEMPEGEPLLVKLQGEVWATAGVPGVGEYAAEQVATLTANSAESDPMMRTLQRTLSGIERSVAEKGLVAVSQEIQVKLGDDPRSNEVAADYEKNRKKDGDLPAKAADWNLFDMKVESSNFSTRQIPSTHFSLPDEARNRR